MSFFAKNGNSQVITQYELDTFSVQVQSLERTLVDKVFAICDYYLNENTVRNSRHIYDIYKLLTKVDVYNLSLKLLVENVRNDRKPNKTCLSAQDGVNIPELLKKIVSNNFLKKDYYETTIKLLTKAVNYYEAIKSLQRIIDSGLFK